MNEDSLIIEEIVNILMKRWKMIVLITLIITIFSAIISFFIISPKYEASTKVLIGKENTQVRGENQTYDNNDVEMYQKLLKTYAEVIQTNDLIEKAVDLESLGLKSQDILDNLKVTPRVDTQILEIKYTNTDKVLARDILDSVITKFVKSSTEFIPNGNVKIIENVKIPEDPVSPNKKINILITFLLGLMISIGVSFLLEVIDNTFKNKEQTENVLELPVLGVITDFINDEGINRRSSKKKKHEKGKSLFNTKKNSGFTVEYRPNSIVAEAYKTLRTNIHYSSFDKEIKIISVTSAEMAEGKSTVAGNIALTFAQNEKKVMLIDCDLRKPSVHKNFNSSNLAGVSDILLEKATFEESVQKRNDNLYFITSGKMVTNPAEILESSAMTKLIEKIKEEYDIIIVDTAPLKEVTDAQILSAKVDGTILVVRTAITKKDVVIEAKSLLDKVGANIMGIVLYTVKNTKLFK